MENQEDRRSDNSCIANKQSPLEKVGEFLREARQGRNLSVEDLSLSLKIGKEQLIALEAGDKNSLPESVFIRAMVRRIAEKLNLDTSFILEELNENKNYEPNPIPLIKKENPRKRRKYNPFSLIILSGALGLVTSFLVLKYIERAQDDSGRLQKSEIFLLDKS